MKYFNTKKISKCIQFLQEHHEAYLNQEEQVDAMIHIVNKCLFKRLKNNRIELSNFQDVSQYLLFQLALEKNETFAVLFLDTQYRLIAFEKLFFGSLNSCVICPRALLRRILKHNAANVIFAHNHPSGDTKPSQRDIELTKRLKEALALFDVSVLDHIIIGNRCSTSLQKLGHL